MTDHTPTSGTAPARAPMSRRALLMGAPVASLAIAAGGMAAAGDAPTPIMRIFREWRRLHGFLDSAELTEGEVDEVLDQTRELEDQMLALPCTCGMDFVAKIAAYTSFGAFDPARADLWAEADQLLGEGKGRMA